jgi:hypothetical protein
MLSIELDILGVDGKVLEMLVQIQHRLC